MVIWLVLFMVWTVTSHGQMKVHNLHAERKLLKGNWYFEQKSCPTGEDTLVQRATDTATGISSATRPPTTLRLKCNGHFRVFIYPYLRVRRGYRGRWKLETQTGTEGDTMLFVVFDQINQEFSGRIGLLSREQLIVITDKGCEIRFRR